MFTAMKRIIAPSNLINAGTLLFTKRIHYYFRLVRFFPDARLLLFVAIVKATKWIENLHFLHFNISQNTFCRKAICYWFRFCPFFIFILKNDPMNIIISLPVWHYLARALYIFTKQAEAYISSKVYAANHYGIPMS